MKSSLQSLLGSKCPNCDYSQVAVSSSSQTTCAISASVLVPTADYPSNYIAFAKEIETMIKNVGVRSSSVKSPTETCVVYKMQLFLIFVLSFRNSLLPGLGDEEGESLTSISSPYLPALSVIHVTRVRAPAKRTAKNVVSVLPWLLCLFLEMITEPAPSLCSSVPAWNGPIWVRVFLVSL